MATLKIVRSDPDEPRAEPTVGDALHRNRVARFVEENGLDALPEGALLRRIDADAAPDIQLQQLTSMLQAQRVLHGFTPDGKDPNAQLKRGPVQQVWTRNADD